MKGTRAVIALSAILVAWILIGLAIDIGDAIRHALEGAVR